MRSLKADSYSPLYAQLMAQIEEDIQRGLYAVGNKIPPEHELEMNYGVSRVTVRRALQELTALGMLERKQGKGTFVAYPRTHDIPERKIGGFHDACHKAGRTPGIRVLRVHETRADALDRKELLLPEGSNVVETVRLCSADGEAVILEKNHYSMAYAYLENADLGGSLYRLLQDYGIRPEKCLWDISQQPLSEEEAALLEIEKGIPALRIRLVVYDQRQRPMHNSTLLVRGDRYTIEI